MLGRVMQRAAASIGSASHFATAARIRYGASLRPTQLSRKRGPVRRFSGTQGTPRRPPSPPESWTQQPVFRRLLNRYSFLLKTRPLTTKAVTSGIIAGAGDFTCQLLAIYLPGDVDLDEETYLDMDQRTSPQYTLALVSDVDWSRFARFTALGAGFLAPSLHFWYGFLGRRFPGLSMTTVAKRVALDQLVFTPVFMAAFLSLAMLIDGKAAKIGAKLRADYMTTLVTNWGYWIPAQLINFRFIASSYQVLYSNALGFLWNVYLSYQANKVVTDKGAAETTANDADVDDNEREA